MMDGLKIFPLLLTMLLITGCGATTGQLTKEEQTQENLRIQSIIESRGPNADAISLTKKGSLIRDTDEYFSSYGEEKCSYKVNITSLGNMIFLKNPSGELCEEVNEYILNRRLKVLPALEDGNPVDSIAIIKLSSVSRSDGYSSYFSKVTLLFDSVEIVRFGNASRPLDGVVLPKITNITYESVNSLKPIELERGEFEKTQEFQDRLKKAKEINQKSLVFHVEPRGMSYDPDTETFSPSSTYCWKSDNYMETKLIMNDTNYETKSGTNGFGAPWSWSHQSGSKYFIAWSCSDYDLIPSIKMPLSNAKLEKQNIIALAEIELEPQSWDYSNDYASAEFGKCCSRSIAEYKKTARVKKFLVGNKSSGEVYAVHDVVKTSKSKVSGISGMKKSSIANAEN